MYILEKNLKFFSCMCLCKYKLESNFLYACLDRTLKLIFRCRLILKFVSF